MLPDIPPEFINSTKSTMTAVDWIIVSAIIASIFILPFLVMVLVDRI